jgi:hypothetical protein
MEKISKSQFRFTLSAYGRYTVTYTSPGGRIERKASITDMPLIDEVKNEQHPTQKALRDLRASVIHYQKHPR